MGDDREADVKQEIAVAPRAFDEHVQALFLRFFAFAHVRLLRAARYYHILYDEKQAAG